MSFTVSFETEVIQEILHPKFYSQMDINNSSTQADCQTSLVYHHWYLTYITMFNT